MKSVNVLNKIASILQESVQSGLFLKFYNNLVSKEDGSVYGNLSFVIKDKGVIIDVFNMYEFGSTNSKDVNLDKFYSKFISNLDISGIKESIEKTHYIKIPQQILDIKILEYVIKKMASFYNFNKGYYIIFCSDFVKSIIRRSISSLPIKYDIDISIKEDYYTQNMAYVGDEYTSYYGKIILLDISLFIEIPNIHEFFISENQFHSKQTNNVIIKRVDQEKLKDKSYIDSLIKDRKVNIVNKNFLKFIFN